MPRETAAQKAKRLRAESDARLNDGEVETRDPESGPETDFATLVSEPKGAARGADIMRSVGPRANSVGEKLLASIPTSGTVTVACKMPNGLLLRVFDKVEKQELVMGGGVRNYTISEPREGGVRLYGYAVPNGRRPTYPIIGDFALTPNVDAGFFRLWVEQNITTDVVRNGLVFCHKSPHQVSDIARERGDDVKSGFEPMDPAGDKRVAKSKNPNLVDTGTEEGLRKAIGLGTYGG